MIRILPPALAIAGFLGCDPSTPTGTLDTVDADTELLADCEEIWDGRVICFPEGHVC